MSEQKPKLRLSGMDGNAFMLLGLAQRAARKADWSKDKIEAMMAEATKGNYDHLLQTLMKHFDVS